MRIRMSPGSGTEEQTLSVEIPEKKDGEEIQEKKDGE